MARPGQDRAVVDGRIRASQLMRWARLLRRAFEIDREHRPKGGGELKIIAAILERPVVEKIRTHLGIQARAPPRAPARAPLVQAA